MRALATGTLSALGVIVLISWILIAVRHVRDRFEIGWVQGTWMALAQSARRGTLYPALYDGSHYGGTRFMPIPILLHAWLSHLTHGDYLLSGKLLSYFSFALLLGVTFLVLRRVECPTFVSLALLAAIAATETGLLVGTGIGWDALPVALQLAAVMVIARSGRSRATVAAATLCALALFTKVSAVWALIAIVAWLVVRNRRQLAVFLTGFLALVAALAAAFALATDGRFVSNVIGLSFAGLGRAGLVVRMITVFPSMERHAVAAFVLFPLAGVATVLAVRARRSSIYQVSLISAVAVLLVVFTDAGAEHNHLIDVVVLTAVVVGELWASRASWTRAVPVRPIIAVALAWVLIGGFVSVILLTPGGLIDATGGSASAHFPRHPLAAYVRAGDRILSEDPSIPVDLGMRPVVLDAFMLLRLGERHPSWTRDLVARIDRRDFDVVVLMNPLDSAHRTWFETFHFGTAVFQALAENYSLRAEAGPYFVYRPRTTSPSPA